jgi:membrane-associated phospholipid phosphatase
MQWLQTIDVELFRFINERLANPFLDQIMPWASGNVFFYPLLILLCLFLIFKGGARGITCVIVLVLAVAICDGWVCKTLKHAIGRERPFMVLENVRCLIGRGGSPGMPSSHAANWFAGAMVAFIYYRRSWWLTLPLACIVSFSRVYNGVHYPSDVIVGALLGAGSGVSTLFLVNWLWKVIGQTWFPLWWEKIPSLLNPNLARPDEDEEQAIPTSRAARTVDPARHVSPDAHWLRLGYLVIAALLFARLAYIASGTIQLSEDEAYQWLWSKHLALSYYSKPLLIAVTQFLGTSIWGDTAFGVRFFSPVISAVMGFILLRFFARVVNARAAFFLLLIITCTPLLSLGAVLMTIDPLSVLFWTAAMLAGWHAVQLKGKTSDWLWVGIWMGMGLLSKYTELFQLLCWMVFFALWPPARKHLRKPGPYLALLVNAIFSLPVIIWNAQRHWVTVNDVAKNAAVGQPWRPFRFIDFIGSEFALLNPIFFVATVWAAIVVWRKHRNNPLLVYFFSMGAPLFLCYLLWSFHSRILPNWIAPAILPMFLLMVAYWDTRWRLGTSQLKPWLVTGLTLGCAAVLLAHQTDWIAKLTGHYLPVKFDPLHRVRCWSDVAKEAGKAREEILAEGKPTFIITDHYGLAGLISFYLPEAKAAVTETPLVYYRTSPYPRNQFFFWPGYTMRKGENAVFVVELARDTLAPEPAPRGLQDEFESVTNMGIRNVMYHGKINRPLQFYACHNLK